MLITWWKHNSLFKGRYRKSAILKNNQKGFSQLFSTVGVRMGSEERYKLQESRLRLGYFPRAGGMSLSLSTPCPSPLTLGPKNKRVPRLKHGLLYLAVL